VTQLSLFPADKRWKARREHWVTPEDRFLPAGYAVDVVAEPLAREFVVREHYSGSFPAARLCVGLWGPGPTLAGVAVFSVPMSESVLRRWTGGDHAAAVELGRFVCAPSVKFNGETWFLRRCFRILRREKGSRAVLSFADPLERRTAAGALTKAAHHGTVYMAKGALLAGRATPRSLPGILLWAHAEDLAGLLEPESVQLLFTSPPFPLNRRKGYANEHPARAHVDWLVALVERYLPKVTPDGSIVLEVGPAWTPGLPTQATWMERLVVALEDRLGLHLCQTLYWENPAKIPGPAAWTTRERVRLTDRIERLLWLASSPRPYADNRAVLAPYSDAMRRRLAAGGEAARRRPSGHHRADGAFGRDNGGAIPGTLLRVANTASNDPYTRACREAGLPVHPARFPAELPDFVIRFLTREDDLVVDPMCGSARTARAANLLRRRWVCGDTACEYLRGAEFRLVDLPGYLSRFGRRPRSGRMSA
jgi:site-specific DNA-methyltransferase (cytosine-N4-specific)